MCSSIRNNMSTCHQIIKNNIHLTMPDMLERLESKWAHSGILNVSPFIETKYNVLQGDIGTHVCKKPGWKPAVLQ